MHINTPLKFEQCTFIKYSFIDISKPKQSNLLIGGQKTEFKGNVYFNSYNALFPCTEVLKQYC